MIRIENNYSLKKWNTFHLEAKARYFVEYDQTDDLRQLTEQFANLPMLHIGRGSNLLFVHDFEGVVFHSAYKALTILDETDDYVVLKVGSGMIFDDLVSYAVNHNWAGLENLSYIPGEVGASAVQNIGAYGVEVKDVIQDVVVYNIAKSQFLTLTNEQCRYGYRDSIFKNELKNACIVTDVIFRLSKHGELQLDYGNVRQSLQHIANPTISDVRKAIIGIRRQKLPEVDELGSAGSFFKNPVVSREQFLQLQQVYPDVPHYIVDDGVKVPAAWLISQSGMRGKNIGGAQVFEKQPLVIVNTGSATAQDILALANEIQEAVKSQFGISIYPEVNYI